jgi:hypothetical protein
VKDYSKLAERYERGFYEDELEDIDDQEALEARYIATRQLQQIYAQEAKRLKKESEALEQFLAMAS